MPFQSSIRPLKFDKFHFLPHDRWLKEEWNNYIQNCNRTDLPYCQKVALTDMVDRLMFKPNFTGSNLLTTSATFTGTTSTVSTAQVVATGIGTAAEIGYLILNTTTGAHASVTGIVDADTVTITDDIFTTIGHGVSMFSYFTAGPDVFYAEQGQDGILISKDSNGATSTLTASPSLSSGSWYYIRLEVRNYVSGEFTVKFGGNIVGIVDTNGFHEFYGQLTGANIIIETTAVQDFVGSLQLASFELYAVNTTDLIVAFGLDQMDILLSGSPPPNADALKSGIIMLVNPFTWGVLTGCACFYLTIFSDPCYTSNYLQDIKGECWELDANVQIVAETIAFGNAEEGEKARYTCGMFCPIQCGEAYTLSFTVTNYVQGSVEIRFANGSYSIDAAGDYSFTRTPQGLCAGLDVFEITATGPGLTTMDISEIEIRKVPVFGDASLVSECIHACDAAECETTVEYRNDVNVYGFPYEGASINTYRNRLRFCGDLSRARMESNDYQAFKSSSGIYSTVYANQDASERLETELIPPYLAKALTVALEHNDVLINGRQYVAKEVPQLIEQDETGLVMLSCLVVEKDQTETFTYTA